MLHDCALIKYPIMIRRHFAFKKRSTIFDLSVNYWKFFFPPAHPDSLFLSRKHFRRALFALLCTRARKLDTISPKRGGGRDPPPSFIFLHQKVSIFSFWCPGKSTGHWIVSNHMQEHKSIIHSCVSFSWYLIDSHGGWVGFIRVEICWKEQKRSALWM